jgi:hypothetical protein
MSLVFFSWRLKYYKYTFNKIVKDEDKTSFLQFAIVYKIRPIAGSHIYRWKENSEAGTSLENQVLTTG